MCVCVCLPENLSHIISSQSAVIYSVRLFASYFEAHGNGLDLNSGFMLAAYHTHTHTYVAFWLKKNTHNKFDRRSETIFEADCLIVFLEQVKFRDVFFFLHVESIFKMKADKMNMKWREKKIEEKE